MNVISLKKSYMVIFVIIILIINTFPAAAFADSIPNYGNIKLLFTGPFADHSPFGDAAPVIINDVPRFILTPQKEGPFILGGRVYLPMRLVFQILGYDVNWQKDNPIIEISKNGEKIVVDPVGKTVQKGEKITSVPMLLINDRYYIALRAFSEVTGDDILWESDTRTVIYKIKGAKGVLPPVRIVDIKYKETQKSYGYFINGKIHEAIVEGNEITYTLKNTCGVTIAKDSLIRLSNTWNLGENKKASFPDGGSTIRGYDAYKRELKPGGFTGEQKIFTAYGNYEILIFGVVGKDEYVNRVSSYPMPPDTAGWE
ncbi:MAG TPA: copper amine oxidase N-terminal domain-containing protein [Thermoanaerobacterales bacterium]|nr:copper amine oxidase N-terminal domain-containing protein [Thermoanaerobacterales bacterium]